jgi:hypothetical protein
VGGSAAASVVGGGTIGSHLLLHGRELTGSRRQPGARVGQPRGEGVDDRAVRRTQHRFKPSGGVGGSAGAAQLG